MDVSVIIPVLNGEKYLAQTLRSALNQTRPPAEIIVVDNGSTDRSLEIARGFGGIVRTMVSPERGANSARVAGAARADGDALMFLDADDLLGQTVLEELRAALLRRPGRIACCPWMRYERVDGCWRAAPASSKPRRGDQDDLSAWLGGWYHPPCAVLWSRDAYALSGGWDPAIALNQDGDVMMRAFARGAELAPTAGGTAYYRRLPGDELSLSGQRKTRRGLESQLTVLDGLAAVLRETGAIEQYREPLAGAYDGVARASRTAGVDLGERARAAAELHRAHGLRRAAGAVGSLGARIAGRRRLLPAVARHDPAPDRPEPQAEEPLVSVVLPTYNRAHLLDQSLRSVLAQSYKRFELLVVDDGSTDGTAQLVAAIDDPRVRYLPQPRNMGVAAARNRGLREARGDLIAFLDSDDAWRPEKLARQVALFRRRPKRTGLIYTGLTVRGQDGVSSDWTPEARGSVWPRILHENVVHYGTSSTMIRREVVEVVGDFDETMPANEDYDYWTRVARFFEFDFVPEPLITYDNRVDEAAPTDRRSRNFLANMRARDMHVERHGDEAALAGVRYRFQLESARRHLESPDGSDRAGRWLLLKALRDRPRSPRLSAWLAFSMLPRRPRAALAPTLASLRRRLPRRLWYGHRDA